MESIDLQVTVVLNIEVASVINSSNWNDPEQCKGFDKSCGQREIEHTHKVFFRRIFF